MQPCAHPIVLPGAALAPMWPVIGVTLKATLQRTVESMKCSATDVVNIDTGPGTAWETSKGRIHCCQPSPPPRCEWSAPGGRHLCWWDVMFSADWYRLLADNCQCRSMRILKESRCGHRDNRRNIPCVLWCRRSLHIQEWRQFCQDQCAGGVWQTTGV